MIDLGAAVAHKLAARIDDATPAEATQLAAAIERVILAVRRTILLSVHLHKAAEKAAAIRTAGRKPILREASDTISREGLPAAKADLLCVEFVERLDAPDLAPELATRPLGDIILDLKHDMGLGHMPGTPPPQWPRRTPDDIADLQVRAQRPTQPWPTDTHLVPSFRHGEARRVNPERQKRPTPPSLPTLSGDRVE